MFSIAGCKVEGKNILVAILFIVTQASIAEEPVALESEFDKLVYEHREKSGLVSLAAMVMEDNEVILSASHGERKKGSEVPISIEDKWHTGSISKSVTSSMIARLIEKGELEWDLTIKDVFPGAESINEAWLNVTLAQLLTHTSGAKPDFSFYVSLFKNPDRGSDLVAAREAEVLEILAEPPQEKPGETFIYSNLGYTVAAVMAEKTTGQSWEKLVEREVFRPLELNSAGFGPPQDEEKLEQPRGHRRVLGMTFAASTDADNSPIIAPAGGVHMTLSDLVHYANDHLQGESGGGKLLQPATYQRLHTPKLNNYAFGWAKNPEEEWSNGAVLWHNGSNGLWHALVVIIPGYNTVIGVATNDGNIQVAEQNAWNLVKQATALIHD